MIKPLNYSLTIIVLLQRDTGLGHKNCTMLKPPN